MTTLQAKPIVFTSGGGTINIATDSSGEQIYSISGTGTLTSSWTVQPDPMGTPENGAQIVINYNGEWIANGNNITIFGHQMLPEDMLMKWKFVAVFIDGSWQNTVILNYGSDSSVRLFNKTVALSVSDISNLNTSPVKVIDDPQDSSAFIEIISAIATYTSFGTPYAISTDIWLMTDGADSPQAVIENGLGSIISRTMKFSPYNIVSDSDKQMLSGNGILCYAPYYDPSGGNGIIQLDMTYKIKIPAILP